MTLKIERWVFTSDELRDPKGCKRDDKFDASVRVPNTATNDHPDETTGVIVDRRGKSTNFYSDGGVGVTDEQRDLAEVCESLTRCDGGEVEYADHWRDVVTNDRGRFKAFAVQAGIRVTNHRDLSVVTNFIAHPSVLSASEQLPYLYEGAMKASKSDGHLREIVIQIGWPVILNLATDE